MQFAWQRGEELLEEGAHLVVHPQRGKRFMSCEHQRQRGAHRSGAGLEDPGCLACFSIGLALTMVTSGVIAALSVKHVSKRFSGFGEIVRKAPYVSGAVILVIGLYLGINGWLHLPIK